MKKHLRNTSMSLLKGIFQQDNQLPIIAVIIAFCYITTSCDREADDLIKQPSEASTVLQGTIRTPDGTPLPGIPVSVDFNIKGFLGSTVLHKAIGVTDKTGFYKIYFEADNEIGQGLHSGYEFSADFSGRAHDNYIISEKLTYPFTAHKEEWSGSTIKCDFTIPHKKLVNVEVSNSDITMLNGKYTLRNYFTYLKVEGYLLDRKNPWYEMSTWYESEGIDIPQNGIISIPITCALGLENTIRLVYHGDTSYGYPNGIPASESKSIVITENFNEKIELNYITPDPANL